MCQSRLLTMMLWGQDVAWPSSIPLDLCRGRVSMRHNLSVSQAAMPAALQLPSFPQADLTGGNFSNGGT